MDKPDNTPNFIEDVMNNCWEKGPKDRPTFNQLEETIAANLDSSVSSYFLNLNTPYEKFNYEKAVAPKTERFGLAKSLKEKPIKLTKSLYQSVAHGVRYAQSPEPSRLSSRADKSYFAISH